MYPLHMHLVHTHACNQDEQINKNPALDVALLLDTFGGQTNKTDKDAKDPVLPPYPSMLFSVSLHTQTLNFQTSEFQAQIRIPSAL